MEMLPEKRSACGKRVPKTGRPIFKTLQRRNYCDLNALMLEHGLEQSDLAEIGCQGVVSEILSGKRQLNLRQIKIVSKRFKVSPAVFI